jgi:Sec-independent protein translocase protein TatA
MGGLDPAKLLVLLVLALVLLGPERLPKAARQAGAFWHDLQAFRARIEDEVRSAIPDLDLPKIPTMPRGGVTGYLTGLMSEADRSAAARAGTDEDPATGVANDNTDYVSDVETPMSASASAERREAPPGRTVAWQSSPAGASQAPYVRSALPGDGPVVAPAGMPVGWAARGAEAPGYASGSLLSGVPSAAPEALLSAEVRIDLDDPSWN